MSELDREVFTKIYECMVKHKEANPNVSTDEIGYMAIMGVCTFLVSYVKQSIEKKAQLEAMNEIATGLVEGLLEAQEERPV